MNLNGKRILVTQADEFMGPVICEVLAEHGAEVIGSTASLGDSAAVDRVVREAGVIDVLVANLALPAPSTPAGSVTDDEWSQVFRALVDPLPRLVRAAVPEMIRRRAGKILVIGSASSPPSRPRAAEDG